MPAASSALVIYVAVKASSSLSKCDPPVLTGPHVRKVRSESRGRFPSYPTLLTAKR